MFGCMKRERWSPTWAVYLAWAVVVTCGAFTAWLGAAIVDDLSYRGEKFDGLGVVLGSFGIGILLLVVAPWVWFLVRGGKVALGAGAATVTSLLIFASWLGVL